MSSDVKGYYAIVLDDLVKRRAQLLAEVVELEKSILLLQRQSGASSSYGTFVPVFSPSASPDATPKPDFSQISVRWATLWHLSERQEPQKTGDIAKAIIEGGYRTTMGERFSNSVSAVLSEMKNKGEVEAVEDGAYRLTEVGRNAWDHIRRSDRFQSQTQMR